MSDQAQHDQDAADEADLLARIESRRREDHVFAHLYPPGTEANLLREHRERRREFRQLLVDAQAGSQEALGRFVEEHGPQLVDFVRRRRREGGFPNDPQRRGQWQSSVVFDSFESAILKLDQFRGKSPGEFYAWLITICEHKESDRQRAWSAEMRDGAREISWEQGLTDEARQAAECCGDPTPDELAERAEWDETVSAAVDTLDEPARQAIRLRYWNDWTSEQIGEKLGKGAKAVDGLLRRARKQLEKLLPRKPR